MPPVDTPGRAAGGPDAPRLIALDWGTTALRAFLLGAGGRVLDRRAAPRGLLQVPPGGFAAVLAEILGDWRRPGLPALAAGMVGSAQGWREVPYHRGPAGLADLAAGLLPVPEKGPEGEAVLRIVPGILLDGAPPEVMPEVMRGEETQVMGALALEPGLRAAARIVLPGTHSKWVAVRDGRITSFRTYMTGELFAVLRAHSILGRALAPSAQPAGAADEEEAWAAFDRGVDAARAGKAGLAPLLFSARTLVLAGALPAAASLDYLSGLLIGDELRAALPVGEPGIPLALIGDPALCRRYRRAFARLGLPGTHAGTPDGPREIAGATEAGLWHTALAAGLVAGPEETR
ncbi:2-dehydro-3-deoxygalactonokinase [Roseomonas sp. NAR14]|uniref:2-dehydro-3-deoxygalactonokinase n=1 Tax=Roseomonas acroporae TaxID=2937791 RepID=A0A9X1YJC2_9PROT|nr:2-dehydro-3-deoxygalactonokinase [Roseomonas acroporae]MCK8787216.1 2-dehydro-3-deoxygalactonokinase [Roseomonas acroporae]